MRVILIFEQKGMNYDRFYEPLERLARMNDMSVGDYINQLNNTQEQYEVEKEKDIFCGISPFCGVYCGCVVPYFA